MSLFINQNEFIYPSFSLVSWLYLSKSCNIMSLQVQFPAMGVLQLTWLEFGGWSEALGGGH